MPQTQNRKCSVNFGELISFLSMTEHTPRISFAAYLPTASSPSCVPFRGPGGARLACARHLNGLDGSVRAHRGSLRIRWIPRRSEPASEESELVSYSWKLKSWSTKSSSCRMSGAIKYATNRSENAFLVERKHHCLLAEVLSPSLRLPTGTRRTAPHRRSATFRSRGCGAKPRKLRSEQS